MPDNISKNEFALERAKDLEWKKFVSKMDKLKIADSARPSRKQFETTFDPEGSGYDYVSAVNAGMSPELGEDGKHHWHSRVGSTGLLLKGKKHNTWNKLVEGEKLSGYEIFKKSDGRFYSRSN